MEFRRVRFDYHKTCSGLVEVRRVRFDYREACITVLGWTVCLL